MGNSATVAKGTVFQSSGSVLMGRIVKDDGTTVVQADLSAITAHVYDENGVEVTPAPSLTVAGNIFNTQKNAAWTTDSSGFNFSVSLAGTYWPTGGQTYSIELLFTPTSGNAYKAVWQLSVIATYST